MQNNQYQINIKLCSGENCIHRYRCYRHSLYQDALFKNNTFHKINIKECITPKNDEIPGYQFMWLPENTPSI
jgi:Tfp pilus assembly protein PilN